MLPLVDTLPMPWRTIVYALAFLAGLILLERGAGWFVAGVAALAERLHAPQTLFGLLTAGGEWEELVPAHAEGLSGLFSVTAARKSLRFSGPQRNGAILWRWNTVRRRPGGRSEERRVG